MKYSKDPSFLTKFKGKLSWSYKTTAALLKKYEPKLSLHTRTDKAFKAAHKELFTKKGGDRRNRQNVLVTFTDGRVYPRRFVHAMLKEIPILRVSSCFGAHASGTYSFLYEQKKEIVALQSAPSRRLFNSYSSRTRRIWADIYNQRGRRPSWLLSAHIRQVREE